MHYASSRGGLGPLLKGALQQATKKLFNSTLEIQDIVMGKESFRISMAEAANEIHWTLTVSPGLKEDSEKQVEPPTSTTKSSTYSFFDFHAALSSFWCCTADQDEELITLTAAPALAEDDWVSNVRAVLAEKHRQIDSITKDSRVPLNP